MLLDLTYVLSQWKFHLFRSGRMPFKPFSDDSSWCCAWDISFFFHSSATANYVYVYIKDSSVLPSSYVLWLCNNNANNQEQKMIHDSIECSHRLSLSQLFWRRWCSIDIASLIDDWRESRLFICLEVRCLLEIGTNQWAIFLADSKSFKIITRFIVFHLSSAKKPGVNSANVSFDNIKSTAELYGLCWITPASLELTQGSLQQWTSSSTFSSAFKDSIQLRAESAAVAKRREEKEEKTAKWTPQQSRREVNTFEVKKKIFFLRL